MQEVRAWLRLLRGGHNSESPRSGACVGQAGGGGGGSAGKPQGVHGVVRGWGPGGEGSAGSFLV